MAAQTAVSAIGATFLCLLHVPNREAHRRDTMDFVLHQIIWRHTMLYVPAACACAVVRTLAQRRSAIGYGHLPIADRYL